MHLVSGTEGQKTNQSNPDRQAAMGHVVPGQIPQKDRSKRDQYGKGQAMDQAKHRQPNAQKVRGYSNALLHFH
ncbi:MAG TPA: hypothetical protein VE178_12285 [Silvibacterium sp.]|nr:hypothetical protein [Silvibacterium sp.]